VAARLWNGRQAGLAKRLYLRTQETLHDPARVRTPVVWLDRMDDQEAGLLARHDIDLLLSGGFDRILKPSILRVPKLGCVNVHPSLLPRFRGPNPFAHVILFGDTESGVTFHWMDEGVDTGPVIAQFRHPVGLRDSGNDLLRNACQLAETHVARMLESLDQALPQAASEATHAGWLSDEQLTFDWNWSAADIDRLIRAAQPYACARFRHRGKSIFVVRASVEEAIPDAPPGIVLRSGPRPRIAAVNGSLTILRARVESPIPFVWPTPWNSPKTGERME
jgi:methionyl-tRNA formyltransferase